MEGQIDQMQSTSPEGQDPMELWGWDGITATDSLQLFVDIISLVLGDLLSGGESTCQCKRCKLDPCPRVGGYPGKRNGKLLHIFEWEIPHGERILVPLQSMELQRKLATK